MSLAGTAEAQAATGAALELQRQQAARPTPSVDLSRKNVLVLHSFHYHLPSYVAIDASLTKAFVSNGLNFNTIYFEFMDLARNPDQDYRAHLANIYRDKFKTRHIDLIITVNHDALQFLLNDASDLFPGLPVICVLGTTNKIEHPDPNRRLIILPFSTDIASTVQVITALQPDTRKLIVVFGSSNLDRRLADRVKTELQALKAEFEVEYLGGIPIYDLLERVGNLPPRSAILYTTIYSDSTGKTYMPVDAARMISASANAPLFGLYDTLLGDNGIVGG